MKGTPPIVQTDHVDEHMARVYISFTVPTRYVDYDQVAVDAPHPMVAIAIVGKTSPIRLTRERTAMVNCLQQLQNNVGCFVPDLSYFKLSQLETGEGNVIETMERLCRAHQDVVIYIYI
jgi:selenophosphate synthase